MGCDLHGEYPESEGKRNTCIACVPGTPCSPDAGPESDSSPGPVTLSVELAGTGSGAVRSVPEGIDCGTICSGEFERGTVITLTTSAMQGSSFAGWSGACQGIANQCQVTVDDDTAVAAFFGLAGEHVWSRQVGNNPNVPIGVSTDPAGNVIVAGTYTGTADFGDGARLSDSNSMDAFIANYSPSGELRWLSTFRGAGAAGVTRVTTDEEGNAYVTGSFNGAMVVGGKTHNASEVANFIAKLDATTGEVIWLHTAEGATTPMGLVYVPSADAIVAAGTFVEDVDFGYPFDESRG